MIDAELVHHAPHSGTVEERLQNMTFIMHSSRTLSAYLPLEPGVPDPKIFIPNPDPQIEKPGISYPDYVLGLDPSLNKRW